MVACQSSHPRPIDRVDHPHNPFDPISLGTSTPNGFPASMTLLALLFVPAVLVWCLFVVPRISLPIWLVATVVVGVIAGPLYFSIPTPITSMSFDRFLMLIGAGYLVFIWRRGDLPLPQPARIDCVLLAVVGWFFIRTIGVETLPEESSAFTRWLTFIAMPFGLYVMVRLAPLSTLQLQYMITTLLGLGVYLAIVAVLEVSGAHSLVYPRYIIDPTNWEFLGRARGPLLNPTANGVVLTTALAIASHRFLHAEGRAKMGYLAIIALIGCGVLFTLTRSVWMGAFGLAVVISIVYLPRWFRVWSLAICVLMGGFIVMDDGSGLLAMKRDDKLSAADAAKSVTLRPLLAIVAYEMWKDKPITGHGFGGYFTNSGPYHSLRGYDKRLDDVRPYMQHNFLSSFAVDTGLIGVGLFALWMIGITFWAWRLMTDFSLETSNQAVGLLMTGVLIGYFVNGMFHDVSAMPMLNNLLFFAGALTTNLAYRSDVVTSSAERSGERRGSSDQRRRLADDQTAPSPNWEMA